MIALTDARKRKIKSRLKSGVLLFHFFILSTLSLFVQGASMTELDQEWARRLEEAQLQARAAGRSDVAEYLSLRASNDLLRATGIEWLLESFRALAGEAVRAGASVRIEHEDAHSFTVGNANMIGTLLTLRYGVRALVIEAGWPRAPRDGFVRGGGLANARVRHFGLKGASQELLLVRAEESGAPQWLAIEETGGRTEFQEAQIRQHLGRFLGVA